MRCLTPLTVLLAVALLAVPGTAQCELGALAPLDHAAGDGFGAAISLDGDMALVGAPHKAGVGAAYLFQRTNVGWVQVAKLTASDGESGDRFGAAVALHRFTALVGAPGEDDGGSAAGAAYAFEQLGASWIESAKLKAPSPAQGAEFGHSVTLRFGFAVVGAPGEDGPQPASGVAHSFFGSFAGWSWLQTIADPGGQSGDRFGTAVGFDGFSLLVGAPFDDAAAPDSGAAHLFQQGAVSFFHVAEVTVASAQGFENLGASVAVEDSRLLAGAPFAPDPAGAQTGAAYVFEPAFVGWAQTAKLVAADAAQSDGAGAAVALAGDRVLVGAPQNLSTFAGEGRAFAYQLAGIDWVQTATLSAADGMLADHFGGAVALHPADSLVGAMFDDPAGAQSGAVRRFSAGPMPAVYCTAKTTSSGCEPQISASGQPGPAGAYVVRITLVEPGQAGVLFYGTSGAAAEPFQGGTLCVQPPVRRLPPQGSGGSGPCTGSLAFDFSAWIASGIDPALAPGQQAWLQGWFRDAGAASGSGLSDALTSVVCN